MTKNDNEDIYALLGVSSKASHVDIKKAYRKMAMKYHPDRQTTESERESAHHKFAKLSAAYEILSDPVQRKCYNEKYERMRRRRKSRPDPSVRHRGASSASKPARWSLDTPISPARPYSASSGRTTRYSAGPLFPKPRNSASTTPTKMRPALNINLSPKRKSTPVASHRSSIGEKPTPTKNSLPSNLPLSPTRKSTPRISPMASRSSRSGPVIQSTPQNKKLPLSLPFSPAQKSSPNLQKAKSSKSTTKSSKSTAKPHPAPFAWMRSKGQNSKNATPSPKSTKNSSALPPPAPSTSKSRSHRHSAAFDSPFGPVPKTIHGSESPLYGRKFHDPYEVFSNTLKEDFKKESHPKPKITQKIVQHEDGVPDKEKMEECKSLEESSSTDTENSCPEESCGEESSSPDETKTCPVEASDNDETVCTHTKKKSHADGRIEIITITIITRSNGETERVVKSSFSNSSRDAPSCDASRGRPSYHGKTPPSPGRSSLANKSKSPGRRSSKKMSPSPRSSIHRKASPSPLRTSIQAPGTPRTKSPSPRSSIHRKASPSPLRTSIQAPGTPKKHNKTLSGDAGVRVKHPPRVLDGMRLKHLPTVA